VGQNDDYSGWVREKPGATDKSGSAVGGLRNRIIRRSWIPWASGIFGGAALLIFCLFWFFDFFQSPESSKEIQPLSQRVEPELPPQKEAAPAPPTSSPAAPDAVKEVATLLKQGRYQEARDMAAKFPGQAEMVSVIENIDTPLALKLSFQFQKPGESPSPILPIGSPELSNLTLTHRDNYRFFFDTEDKETYLYIFQLDDLGKVKRIFPDPQTMEWGNPLQSAVRYRTPPKENDWYYLDELTGDTQSIKETLLFVAARWPADDLDEGYSMIHRSTEKKEWEKAFQHLKERIGSYKALRKPGVLYRELILNHGR
jgi:hypothetical protein